MSSYYPGNTCAKGLVRTNMDDKNNFLLFRMKITICLVLALCSAVSAHWYGGENYGVGWGNWGGWGNGGGWGNWGGWGLGGGGSYVGAGHVYVVRKGGPWYGGYSGGYGYGGYGGNGGGYGYGGYGGNGGGYGYGGYGGNGGGYGYGGYGGSKKGKIMFYLYIIFRYDNFLVVCQLKIYWISQKDYVWFEQM